MIPALVLLAAAACYTPEQLVADAAKAGDKPIAVVQWVGDNADGMIVIQGTHEVSTWAVKDGCVVAHAVLDTVTRQKGIPA